MKQFGAKQFPDFNSAKSNWRKNVKKRENDIKNFFDEKRFFSKRENKKFCRSAFLFDLSSGFDHLRN